VRVIARGIRNFDVSVNFRSRLMSQHQSDAARDIATLTFDLAGDGPSRRYGSSFSLYTKFEVRSLVGQTFPVRRYDTLLVSALADLVTLTFDDETDAHYCPWGVGWTTFLPILEILQPFVLDLSVNTSQMRHVTLRVHRPSCSEDMTHFWSHISRPGDKCSQ